MPSTFGHYLFAKIQRVSRWFLSLSKTVSDVVSTNDHEVEDKKACSSRRIRNRDMLPVASKQSTYCKYYKMSPASSPSMKSILEDVCTTEERSPIRLNLGLHGGTKPTNVSQDRQPFCSKHAYSLRLDAIGAAKEQVRQSLSMLKIPSFFPPDTINRV